MKDCLWDSNISANYGFLNVYLLVAWFVILFGGRCRHGVGTCRLMKVAYRASKQKTTKMHFWNHFFSGPPP